MVFLPAENEMEVAGDSALHIFCTNCLMVAEGPQQMDSGSEAAASDSLRRKSGKSCFM